MNAYCKWWEKPLEEVEEDAQEVCLKEDRSTMTEHWWLFSDEECKA